MDNVREDCCLFCLRVIEEIQDLRVSRVDREHREPKDLSELQEVPDREEIRFAEKLQNKCNDIELMIQK